MNPIVRNILAVVAGIIVGGVVNMGIIKLGPSIIPLPEGVDPTDIESIKANIHLYQAKHFIVPFLAHALGTLVGAFTAAKIAATNKMRLALGIGFLFLIGGIMMVFSVPAPTWFDIVDIVGAYIPMALIGGSLASGRSS